MKLTDKQRVLRLAMARENRGICAVDFLLPNIVDGGKPITRLAARIRDLKDEGIEFADGGRRSGVKVYILDRASLAEATKPTGTPESSSRDSGDDGRLSSEDRDSQNTGVPVGATTSPLFQLGIELARTVAPRSAINDDLDDAA